MRKLNLLAILIFFSPLFWRGAGGEAFSQSPLVKQWDKRFGGTSLDAMTGYFIQTRDSGFMMAGYSASDSSGDKTEGSWGSYDYWIVKTDSAANKLWDKRFGGSGYDALYCFQQTKDNGYILGGTSTSGVGGDKTQACWGSYDYWIVKTDSVGNKQWDKRFGGTNEDVCYSLQQTTDGGYILGGWSNSDSSGDKTQSCWGSYDYWIVKIDSLGSKQWDKRFGGNSMELLAGVRQLNDGGFIFGGISGSGISGDKTQACQGSYDYWIVKTDSVGNKEWDKRFGGGSADYMDCLQLTNDGGFIIGGWSTSGISGDKSEAGCGAIATHGDCWIVKIDSLGNKLWDKDYGGGSFEEATFNIINTNDNGLMISARSFSDSSCDKSQNNLGNEQSWFVKLDSLGNKKWDKTVFTLTQQDAIDAYAIQTFDGCYLFGNSTSRGIGGEKTQPSRGGHDYWIIKFCDSTRTTTGIQSAINNPQSAISIYPNPANDYVIINYRFKAGDEIRLTDMLGKILFTETITTLTSDFRLLTSNLSPGIYFLKAGNRVSKFVKE
jgi:hypothetical protein